MRSDVARPGSAVLLAQARGSFSEIRLGRDHRLNFHVFDPFDVNDNVGLSEIDLYRLASQGPTAGGSATAIAAGMAREF